MNAGKQILIVDDSFEILAFLRSLLELADPDFHVLAVPSAEEAFLELHQRPFDLLIADLRLPGMNGLELVRRIRPLRPELPVIALTAYVSSYSRQEATALGIEHYFQKPLDPDNLLAVVRSLLYKREALETAIVAAPAGTGSARSMDIYQQLQRIQSDVGAVQVVFGAVTGEVLFSAGQLGLDIGRLARLAVAGLENSRLMADQLQNDSPLVLLFQAGRGCDLYCMNVGAEHFLILLLEPETTQDRRSVVWDRIRQAVAELTELLQAEPVSAPAVAPDGGTEQPATVNSVNSSQPGARDSQAETTAGKLARKQVSRQGGRDPLLEMLNSFLEQDQLDLDAFWEQALREEKGPVHQQLSFEEARRRGLIPPGINPKAD